MPVAPFLTEISKSAVTGWYIIYLMLQAFDENRGEVHNFAEE